VILSPHEIVWLIDWAGWTGDDPTTGLPHRILGCAVFLGESAGNTAIMGRSTTGDNLGQRDHGLTQVSGRWNGDKIQQTPNWRDPRVNITLAKRIWDEFQASKGNGWLAWSVYSSKSYEQWLPDARMGALFPWPPP